jgi:hypothetical protein
MSPSYCPCSVREVQPKPAKARQKAGSVFYCFVGFDWLVLLGVAGAIRLFGPRSLRQTSSAIFAILGQERRPRPKPRPWADSLKRDFGHDPLLDETGKRMKWVRRLDDYLQRCPASQNLAENAPRSWRNRAMGEASFRPLSALHPEPATGFRRRTI